MKTGSRTPLALLGVVLVLWGCQTASETGAMTAPPKAVPSGNAYFQCVLSARVEAAHAGSAASEANDRAIRSCRPAAETYAGDLFSAYDSNALADRGTTVARILTDIETTTAKRIAAMPL